MNLGHFVQLEVDQLAAGFLSLGLRPGDRLGIWSPNTPAWITTQFATAKAGLILVVLNPAYRVAELGYVVRQAGCKALIVAHQFKSSNYVVMLYEMLPELKQCTPGSLLAPRFPELKHVILMDGEEDVIDRDKHISLPSGFNSYKDVVQAGDSGHFQVCSFACSKQLIDFCSFRCWIS